MFKLIIRCKFLHIALVRLNQLIICQLLVKKSWIVNIRKYNFYL